MPFHVLRFPQSEPPDWEPVVAETVYERAARIFWEEMERLDPTPGDAPSAWSELSEMDRDLYIRAMRRAIEDAIHIVPTTTR